MEKHTSKDDMVKNFENLLAKINALEVTAKDDYQKNVHYQSNVQMTSLYKNKPSVQSP